MSLEQKNRMNVGNGDLYNSKGEPINVVNYTEASAGADGGVIIADTSETTPSEGYAFYALQVLVNATIGSVDGNITGLAGKTLTEGTVIYGVFTSITLSGGSLIAYNIKV